MIVLLVSMKQAQSTLRRHTTDYQSFSNRRYIAPQHPQGECWLICSGPFRPAHRSCDGVREPAPSASAIMSLRFTSSSKFGAAVWCPGDWLLADNNTLKIHTYTSQRKSALVMSEQRFLWT